MNAGAKDVFFVKLNTGGSGLLYSTYLGGTNDDLGIGIALDSTQSAYISGYTCSTNFPTTTGAVQTTYAGSCDAFIAKIGEAVTPASTPGKVTGGGSIQPDGTISPATLLIQTGTNASIGDRATFGFGV